MFEKYSGDLQSIDIQNYFNNPNQFDQELLQDFAGIQISKLNLRLSDEGLMKPLMILALGVTLVLTGLACSYVAISLVKKNSEIAISIITALFVAFGEFNGVAAPWIGLLIGLFLSLTLVDHSVKEN